jgi:hypothetical protein
MHLLGLEIKRDRRVKDTTFVTCYKCAKDYLIFKENVRVYNYCQECR